MKTVAQKRGDSVASPVEGSGRQRRLRLLYVQRPAGGGTAAHLVETVAALDRDRYDPWVLCYHANDWCDRLREAGARVHVLGDGPAPDPIPDAVRSVTSGLRRSYGLRQLNRLIRRQWSESGHLAELMREISPDIVHHNDNPRGDRASILAAWRAGIPQVCHVHFMPRYFAPVDWPIARLPDRFLYVSEAVERHSRSALGIPARKGRILYNAFDFAAFRECGEEERIGLRRELSLPPDSLVMTNVGRIVPWKGFDVYLRAVAELCETRPRARALIVGPARDEGYLNELRDLARELGIADRVTFTGFRDDVPRILAASDVVVHSAIEPEPFGRVVVEGMAAGRPVVATAAGGVREIVDHGRTGYLVPPGDAGRMAAAIGELLAAPESRRRLGEGAAKAVRDRFSLERFTDELTSVYEAMGGVSAKRPRAVEAAGTTPDRGPAGDRGRRDDSSHAGGETWT